LSQAASEKKVRVHNLAKDLEVDSKAIIAKCKAEGIELPNHMAVLSAGLQATIREWFSEGAHTTTEESTDRVDLPKARKPARKKKEEPALVTLEPAAPEELAAPAAEPETMPAPAAPAAEPAPSITAEAPADAGHAPAAAPAAPSHKPETIPPARVAAKAPPRPGDAHAPAKHSADAARGRPATTAGRAAGHPPQTEADKSAPAGPQNIPRPAQLQGPRVVRMDRPDVLPPPRPAARGPGGFGPRGAPPPPPPIGAPRRRDDGRGRAPGDDEEDRSRAGAEKKVGANRARVNPRRSVRDVQAEIGEKLREWRDRDLLERKERLEQASGRVHRAVEAPTKREGGTVARAPATRPTRLEMEEPVVVKEFCRVTGVAFDQILPKLMAQGMIASLNKVIDAETAQLLALEFGLELTVKRARTGLDRLREQRTALERKHLASRPPIVTILGHVDHGKTSLLDRIRSTKVAAQEAGGITQHIGAYRVKAGERYVTFLDTPGHAAFTAMRARGANLTDVVVLVVAANDGVMPQTIEAINHARAANVPIVVALNKIDLPGIDLNKVYGQLAEQQLTPQDWGGETDVIKTSANTGEGIAELLEHLAALSELLELKADTKLPAYGAVVEAQMKEGVGPVSRIMVREGTLKNGAVVVCGPAFGKVRSMKDENGKTLTSAGPATPVELSGLSSLPDAGDELFEVDSLQDAKQIADEVQRQRREASLTVTNKPTDLQSLLAVAGEEKIPELNVILKADVQGSADVLRKTLGDIPADEVKLVILHSGVGAVNDGDVALAAASRAIIIAFNVVAEPTTQRAAQEQRVEIRTYRVIYEVEDDLRKALAGLLAPQENMESRGRVEVREVFNIGRVGRVAGCFVRDGIIARSHKVRVLRDSVPVKEGATLSSLKRFKDDVREVRAGLECGVKIEGFDDVKPGDIIEAYEVVKVERTI